MSKVINHILAFLVLLVLTVSSTAQAAPTATPLSLSVTGAVLNAGNQTYSVSGGTVVFAMVDGQTVNPGATISYSLSAHVVGVTVSGNAHFHLTGTIGETRVDVQGTVPIQTMADPVYLPLGCIPPSCNSAIPAFFQGTSNIQVTRASSIQSYQPETMELESPYLNPWGAPIIIASTDGAIVIATTYTIGTIQWQNSQLGGLATGMFGSQAVTGNFNLTSTENENLVTGTATDQVQMAFTKMNIPSLNAAGKTSGTSVIPTSGAYDCSALTGVPGTCTQTGFASTGQFTLKSQSTASQPALSITGIYQTMWGVPALGYMSSVTATTTPQ